MKTIHLTTPEELIHFVRTTDIDTSQLNSILIHCIGGIFIEDRTPQERAQYLERMFERFPNERPIFIDFGDIGVLE
jgi:hypothetical protein